MTKIRIAPALAVLLLAASTWATDYYVSPSGKDTNNGSQTAPWQTITKVNGVNFSAGDRIFFQGSQTFNGKLYFDANDGGTASSPITISSYGTGRATINGGTSDALFAYNTAGLTISNLNFSGNGTSDTGSGIVFYNDLAGSVKLGHVYIDSVEIHGFKDGINIGAWNGVSGYDDVHVTNASVHDNWDNNILTYGQGNYALTHVYVGHCQTFNSSGDPNKTPTSSGSGIVLGSVNGATIEHCLSYNNGWLCAAPAGPCGIWCYQSNAVTIQYNEAWRNQAVNADGDGFDLDGDTQNSVLQYNYSHDNDAAGYLICEFSGAANANSNNTVRYNISENDGRKRNYGAIHFYNAGIGLQNCEVYNNTIFTSAPGYGSVPAINVYSPTSNVHIRNNILVTTGGMPLVVVNSGQSGLLFDHNCYWSSGAAFSIQDQGVNYGSLDAWRAATAQEPTASFTADPLLTSPGNGGTIGNADALASLSAYKLQSSSRLIDAGQNLNLAGIATGSIDFYGTTTPQGSGYDIGACEVVLAANRPPSVSLTSPTSGANFTAPASVTVTASASDSDGTIAKVDFYAGSTRIGSATGAPYSVTWSNVGAGSYSLTAVATDNLGASTTSAAVAITVAQAANNPPVISSAATASPNPATAGSSVTFAAAASDPDGNALSYAWTFGDGASANGPSAVHAYAAAGTYTASVTVSDGLGGSVSSSVVVTVQAATGGKTIHVSKIAMSLSTSRKGTSAVAAITLVDSTGTVVSGAAVSGAWSGLTSAAVSGNTSSRGTVSFSSARTKSTGSFTFMVTNVVPPAGSTATYAPSQNAATSGTITTSGQITTAAAVVASGTPVADSATNSSGTPADTVSLADVTVNQPFKFKLIPPVSLADASTIRATATGLPGGVRISGTMIGGKAKQPGNYTITVHFQGKTETIDESGAPLSAIIQVSQNISLTVVP